MAEDCIFCKIIKGEIPGMKIYEDEYTFAFLDIAKDVDGHTLVVPKKHVTNALDCDTETMHHVMDTVQKISRHYVEKCGYDGVNILNASNESAGQTVFHLHMHIVPRRASDDFTGWPVYKGAKESLEETHSKLKM